MRKRIVTFVVLGTVAVIAAQAYTRLRAGRSPGQAGDPAPAFALPSSSGADVALSALRGKVVAVNFWATWCPPCKSEIPDFAAVYAAARDRGQCLEVLGVAEDSGSREEIVAAARQLGINYPVLFDDDGAIGEAYRVPAYPRTYLIDTEGRLRHTFRGAISRAELEAGLAPLLAEAPASCPRASL